VYTDVDGDSGFGGWKASANIYSMISMGNCGNAQADWLIYVFTNGNFCQRCLGLSNFEIIQAR
jgi:hypothetical protein